MKRSYVILAAAVLGLGSSVAVQASTGNFLPTGPLTNAFLSVDLNGGPLSSAAAPTNGWNENTTTGGFSADNFSVLWTGWGGNQYSGGDNTQLPSSQSSPNVFASSISKTFSVGGSSYYGVTNTVSPTVTATVSESGTASSYAQGGGGATMNSRDRGSPSGANGLNDNDMFRDLLFAGGSGSNVQSSNYLQLSLSGLAPNTAYTVATYSYDSSGGHTTNWTATAPTVSNGISGYWAASPVGNNTFTVPSGGEQSITWTAGTTPAPAIFTLTSDGTGTINLYGWGGDGISGDASADTTYLDGFQIAVAVPEPASLGLLAVGGLAMLRRRRAI
jgi:hypothetical protein